MQCVVILLIFTAIFEISYGEHEDPPNLSVSEKRAANGDAFAFSFSGGFPTNFQGFPPFSDFFQNLINQQQEFQKSISNLPDAIVSNIPFQPYPKTNGMPIDSAIAGAAIGPGGVYQAAQVFPENPNAPNIQVRFSGNPSDGGNFYSVATSSQVGTQTMDGKTTGFRKATTTVNDNGKVTSYTAHDP